MTTVILVIHIILALSLIGVVLLQRSEGGALGIGGSGGAGGGHMTGRSASNLLTRTTAILATCFVATSLALAILASGGRERSILNSLPPPVAPAQSSAPIAPTSE